jgi:uncharacterized membrane protein
MSGYALSIVLGIALAAATGFRVFLPLLVVSAASYTGHLTLDDDFTWLGTSSAPIMLSVASLVEIVAYYVPVSTTCSIPWLYEPLRWLGSSCRQRS